MKTLTKELQSNICPKEALEILRTGNQRFIRNSKVNRDLLKQVKETTNGQFPFAVTLSCIDSRTSVELIFDQGIGDLFSVRIAGNVLNEDILGSMEFACKVAGSKLIVVLGHTSCGAIKGACDHVEMGNLTSLLDKIQPAINSEKTELNSRDSSNKQFVEKVTTIHIKKSVQLILEKSPILKEMVNSGEIGIVGAIHDISTGEVQFYDDCIIMNNKN